MKEATLFHVLSGKSKGVASFCEFPGHGVTVIAIKMV
jgi:hypothetical protein